MFVEDPLKDKRNKRRKWFGYLRVGGREDNWERKWMEAVILRKSLEEHHKIVEVKEY